MKRETKRRINRIIGTLTEYIGCMIIAAFMVGAYLGVVYGIGLLFGAPLSPVQMIGVAIIGLTGFIYGIVRDK